MEPISTRIVPEERDYQIRINEKMDENWRKGLTSQLVVAPTGSGKTYMGLRAINNLLVMIEEKEGIAREHIGIGWSAMRSNLLSQAKEENQRMMGLDNFHAISLFDKNPEQLVPYKRKIVVFDEAHHSCTQSAVDVYEKVKPDYIIGLSATPIRADKMHLSFQVTINDGNYSSLIQDGYLSQFNHFTMKGGYSPENIARIYLRDIDRWGKNIVFFHTERECQRLSQIYRDCGVDHEVVTGSTDRFAQLERFENGEINVLINMLILTEGFNCPSLKTVFVRDSKSKSLITQMSGRVLRKFEGIEQKNIVQSENSKMPFTRIAKPHRLYFENEDKWAVVGVSETVEKMSSLMKNRLMLRFSQGKSFGNQSQNKLQTWSMADAKNAGTVIFTPSETHKKRERTAQSQKATARAIFAENTEISKHDFIARLLDQGLTEQLSSIYYYAMRREHNRIAE